MDNWGASGSLVYTVSNSFPAMDPCPATPEIIAHMTVGYLEPSSDIISFSTGECIDGFPRPEP